MLNNKFTIPYEILLLESQEIITTNKEKEYTEFDEIPFYYYNEYLYHGIRFQKYLEKLENIFKEKKLLAGKYIKDYYNYTDNCNKGLYVSLLNCSKTNRISFETFIEENISLLITPYCNAQETKYVDFYTWEKIKNLNLKQIYSYLPGECMCKDYIPIEYIKAIGVPYLKISREKGEEYTNQLLVDIKILMKQYNLQLPIVDTSRYNHIIINQKEHKLIKKLNKN